MSGFNFGQSTNASGGGGFAFGTQTTTGAAPQALGGGFAFGTPSAQQPAAAPQQQTTSGFALSLKPQNPGTQVANAAPSLGGGFAFGTPAPSQPAPGTQPQNIGFALRSTTTTMPISNAPPAFSLVGSSSTQPPAGGLNLTKPPATGFNFGLGGNTQVTQQQNAPGALPFGASATTTTQPPSTLLTGLLGATTTAPAPTGGSSLFAAPSLNLGNTIAAGQSISLGGGGQLKPPATVAPTLTLGVVKTSAPTLSLGGAPATIGGVPATLGGVPATLGGVPATLGISTNQGFKLGGTSTVATTASSLGFNVAGTTAISSTTGVFGLAGATTSGATLSTVTSTTASTATPQAINYRQLEEQINKWTLELEEQEKIFIQQATQVNAWDRLLIDNGDKIAQLNTDVEKVKLDQQHLDQELDFISAQQKELEELLAPLEQVVEQIPPIHYQQHADLEREHTYKLAENIDAQLKRMVQDLKEIIDHINTSNSTQDNNDPVQQIAKVLNAHMDSLQWIDQNTVLLQRRVDEVTKVSEQRKKEQERNFRLAYD